MKARCSLPLERGGTILPDFIDRSRIKRPDITQELIS
jgi:hypothetical protein